jgi:hypothetical protein
VQTSFRAARKPSAFAEEHADPHPRLAVRHLYHSGRALRERDPPDHHYLTLPSAGVGALLLMAVHYDLSVIAIVASSC